jgi:uncharacterized protein YfaP (DUF2135 family)
MNALIAAHEDRIDTKAIDLQLSQNLASDIRIVLSWDTDDTDMNLVVIEPNGEKTYSSGYHATTQTGGRMTANHTQGYGPEEFMLKKAIPGVYRVEVRYDSDSRQTLDRGSEVTALVTVFRKFGTPEQTQSHTALRLKTVGETATVAEFTVEE